jgi:hypothetical protein
MRVLVEWAKLEIVETNLGCMYKILSACSIISVEDEDCIMQRICSGYDIETPPLISKSL